MCAYTSAYPLSMPSFASLCSGSKLVEHHSSPVDGAILSPLVLFAVIAGLERDFSYTTILKLFL